MTITLPSRRTHSPAHTISRILAWVVRALVIVFILACFAGIVVVLVWAVTAKGW